MSWSPITTDHVLAALNHAELEKYSSIRDQGQPDPLPILIESTISEARGYLASRVQLSSPKAGPQGTVPASLINPVIDIIIHRLCKRVATDTQAQRTRPAELAYERLRSIADGSASFELHDDSSPVTAPSFPSRTLTHQRPHQDGL
jgi:phage gp36-like protein